MPQIMQALTVPTLLVVGDERLKEWTPSSRHAGTWQVTKRVDIEGSLTRIGAIVREELEQDTAMAIQAILIVGLNYELLYRTIHENEAIYLKLSSDPSVSDIYNIASSLDKSWRSRRQLTVMWALPAPPNFLKFNCIMAERQGVTLSKFDKTECIGMEEMFREVVKHIHRRFSIQKLLMHPLREAPRGERDNGIIARKETIAYIMHDILSALVAQVPQERPTILGRYRTSDTDHFATSGKATV